METKNVACRYVAAVVLFVVLLPLPFSIKGKLMTPYKHAAIEYAKAKSMPAESPALRALRKAQDEIRELLADVQPPERDVALLTAAVINLQQRVASLEASLLANQQQQFAAQVATMEALTALQSAINDRRDGDEWKQN